MSKNIPFKIIMSRGDDIPIDSSELEKVITAIAQRKPVVVKQGIFNPSFYVSIVKDRQREESWREELRYAKEEDKPKMIKTGVKELDDMFKEVRDKLMMIKDSSTRTEIQEEVAREERNDKYLN